jgi:hypothetical protein
VVTTLAGIYRLKSGGVGSSDPDTDGGVNWELIPTQAKVDAKADKATTYTETEVDGLLNAKANQATTYTKLETVAEFNQYGLGGSSPPALNDANDMIIPGTFAGPGSNGVNFPDDTKFGVLRVSARGISILSQEALFGGDEYYIRYSNDAGSSWTSWERLVLLSGASFTGNISAPNLSGTNTGDQTLNEIGVGQTWQDLSGSRSAGITYTNSTGKPINLFLVIRDGGSSGFTFSIDGISLTYRNLANLQNESISLVIPNGVQYGNLQLNGNNIRHWLELR